MLLAIDVGNTNVVIGLFDDASSADPVDHWRATTDARRTSDEWRNIIQQFLAWRSVDIAAVSGIVVASGVPKVTNALVRMGARIGVDPLIVNSEVHSGIELRIDEPRQAGADRIANAVAVHAEVDGPAIVVDFGTATTLDVVSADGALLGCVIIPGVEISLDALFDRAAALKQIELSVPSQLVGTNTTDAVRSGATYGYAAQIDGLCAQIEADLGPCTVLATGGLATVIASLSRRIQRQDPWLTLRGLRRIYQRNQV